MLTFTNFMDKLKAENVRAREEKFSAEIAFPGFLLGFAKTVCRAEASGRRPVPPVHLGFKLHTQPWGMFQSSFQ